MTSVGNQVYAMLQLGCVTSGHHGNHNNDKQKEREKNKNKPT